MKGCQGSADIDNGTYGEISTRSIHLEGFHISATVDLILGRITSGSKFELGAVHFDREFEL